MAYYDGTRGGGAFQVYFRALQVYFIDGAPLFHSTKCFLIGIFMLFPFNIKKIQVLEYKQWKKIEKIF